MAKRKSMQDDACPVARSLDLVGDRWSLLLVPREARLRGWVLEIRIDGERNEVRTVEILQSDKDRSLMTVQKAAAQ